MERYCLTCKQQIQSEDELNYKSVQLLATCVPCIVRSTSVVSTDVAHIKMFNNLMNKIYICDEVNNLRAANMDLKYDLDYKQRAMNSLRIKYENEDISLEEYSSATDDIKQQIASITSTIETNGVSLVELRRSIIINEINKTVIE